jgi:hypothetical protein
MPPWNQPLVADEAELDHYDLVSLGAAMMHVRRLLACCCNTFASSNRSAVGCSAPCS